MNLNKELGFLMEFKKFITASASGKRLMPSGKKIKKSTLEQYRCVLKLLVEYESGCESTLYIRLLIKPSLRFLQKQNLYWDKFYKSFTYFLFQKKKYYDQTVSGVFKILKTFFHYLVLDKALPVGEFYKKFRIPAVQANPVILTPRQLRFLIADKNFEESLTPALIRAKDIFVFGCTVALRYSDLMQLKKTNIQYTQDEIYIVLHTTKTGTEIKVPLPFYALQIIRKYSSRAGRYVLPRISGTNLNLHIKKLMKKAGWDYYLPKIRHRQGRALEIKKSNGDSFRFCDHITIHTMRRTAITTLLMLGVDESSVRRISGHSPGSKEFYRYVVVVQDYLTAKVKEAHHKLLVSGNTTQCS